MIINSITDLNKNDLDGFKYHLNQVKILLIFVGPLRKIKKLYCYLSYLFSKLSSLLNDIY